jgi:hypothetical protein
MAAARMSRMVQVSVTDSFDQPFWGARIDFLGYGTLLASLHNSVGKASVELPADMQLEVRISAPGALQVVHLRADESRADVRLNVARQKSLTAPRPVAECPNGTQGQPCVNCPVGGSIIRVCG